MCYFWCCHKDTLSILQITCVCWYKSVQDQMVMDTHHWSRIGLKTRAHRAIKMTSIGMSPYRLGAASDTSDGMAAFHRSGKWLLTRPVRRSVSQASQVCTLHHFTAQWSQ
eukprot:scpid105843/ scgid31377/ 